MKRRRDEPLPALPPSPLDALSALSATCDKGTESLNALCERKSTINAFTIDADDLDPHYNPPDELLVLRIRVENVAAALLPLLPPSCSSWTLSLTPSSFFASFASSSFDPSALSAPSDASASASAAPLILTSSSIAAFDKGSTQEFFVRWPLASGPPSVGMSATCASTIDTSLCFDGTLVAFSNKVGLPRLASRSSTSRPYMMDPAKEPLESMRHFVPLWKQCKNPQAGSLAKVVHGLRILIDRASKNADLAPTHVFLDSGKARVEWEDVPKWHAGIAAALQKGHACYVTELRTPFYRYFCDFDCVQPEPLRASQIEELVRAVLAAVRPFFMAKAADDPLFYAIVCSTGYKAKYGSKTDELKAALGTVATSTLGACVLSDADRKSFERMQAAAAAVVPVSWKTGVHVIFPNMFVNDSMALFMREAIIYALKNTFGPRIYPCNDWEDVVDKSVYGGSGLRMIGNRKADKCPQCHSRKRVMQPAECGLCEDDNKRACHVRLHWVGVPAALLKKNDGAGITCPTCQGTGRVDTGRPYMPMLVMDSQGTRCVELEEVGVCFGLLWFALLCIALYVFECIWISRVLTGFDLQLVCDVCAMFLDDSCAQVYLRDFARLVEDTALRWRGVPWKLSNAYCIRKRLVKQIDEALAATHRDHRKEDPEDKEHKGHKSKSNGKSKKTNKDTEDTQDTEDTDRRKKDNKGRDKDTDKDTDKHREQQQKALHAAIVKAAAQACRAHLHLDLGDDSAAERCATVHAAFADAAIKCWIDSKCSSDIAETLVSKWDALEHVPSLPTEHFDDRHKDRKRSETEREKGTGKGMGNGTSKDGIEDGSRDKDTIGDADRTSHKVTDDAHAFYVYEQPPGQGWALYSGALRPSDHGVAESRFQAARKVPPPPPGASAASQLATATARALLAKSGKGMTVVLESGDPIAAAMQDFIRTHAGSKYCALVVDASVRTNKDRTVYWTNVRGPNQNYCANIGREHNSNRIFFEFSAAGMCTRCHKQGDATPAMKHGPCEKYRSSTVPLTPELKATLFPKLAAKTASLLARPVDWADEAAEEARSDPVALAAAEGIVSASTARPYTLMKDRAALRVLSTADQLSLRLFGTPYSSTVKGSDNTRIVRVGQAAQFEARAISELRPKHGLGGHGGQGGIIGIDYSLLGLNAHARTDVVISGRESRSSAPITHRPPSMQQLYATLFRIADGAAIAAAALDPDVTEAIIGGVVDVVDADTVADTNADTDKHATREEAVAAARALKHVVDLHRQHMASLAPPSNLFSTATKATTATTATTLDSAPFLPAPRFRNLREIQE